MSELCFAVFFTSYRVTSSKDINEIKAKHKIKKKQKKLMKWFVFTQVDKKLIAVAKNKQTMHIRC